MLNGCADGSVSASPVQLPPRQLGGNDNVSLLDGAGIRSDDDGSAAERPPLSKAAAAACSGSPWAMRCAGVRTTVIQVPPLPARHPFSSCASPMHKPLPLAVCIWAL